MSNPDMADDSTPSAASGSRQFDPSIVYKVAKWRQVYETSESRRYKTLHWVASPIDFESRGLQQLHEQFPDDPSRIYGTWMLLVLVAARATVRGVLAHSDGTPFTAKHCEFVSRFPGADFVDVFDWAVRVGWLIPFDEQEDLPEELQNLLPCREILPAGQEITQATEPNPTKQDMTKPHPTKPVRGEGDSTSWEDIRVRLERRGVKANGPAVANARSNGWSVTHAAAVVDHFESKPAAWNGFELFERFRKPADVIPTDGWPEPSAEYKAVKNQDDLEGRTQAEKVRRERQKAQVAAERKKNGPPQPFTPQLHARQKQSA